MSIELVKRHENNKFVYGQCWQCKCEFKALQTDLKQAIQYNRVEGYESTKCPECDPGRIYWDDVNTNKK